MDYWIVNEANKWQNECDEIHNKYFKTGIFTHLKIYHVTNNKMIAWEYTFRDLGMDHSLGKIFKIEENTIIDLETYKKTVINDRDTLINAVFDHFTDHLKTLYTQLGIDNKGQFI